MPQGKEPDSHERPLPPEFWFSTGGTCPSLLLSVLIAYVPEALSPQVARSISLVSWQEICT